MNGEGDDLPEGAFYMGKSPLSLDICEDGILSLQCLEIHANNLSQLVISMLRV
jgi:hypothetical protein